MAGVGWRTLGEYVRRERVRRRQTQAEFARDIQISTRVLGSIEVGAHDRYDPRTIAAIEDAMRWDPGSVVDVVEGRKPRSTVDDLTARLLDAWQRLSLSDRAMLADVVEIVARHRH